MSEQGQNVLVQVTKDAIGTKGPRVTCNISLPGRHLVYMPATGQFSLAGIYLAGVFFKGSIWAIAYRAENPGCSRWIYRPFMSVMTAVCFSLLLPYSALTMRRNVWARG